MVTCVDATGEAWQLCNGNLSSLHEPKVCLWAVERMSSRQLCTCLPDGLHCHGEKRRLVSSHGVKGPGQQRNLQLMCMLTTLLA